MSWPVVSPAAYSVVDEFVASGVQGWLNWLQTNSGSGAASTDGTSEAGHPGVLDMSTGTTTTGRAAITNPGAFGTGGWLLGAGMRMALTGLQRVVELSDAVERYTVHFGLGGNFAGDVFPNDGIFFVYDDATSANWLARTVSGSTPTTIDTGVPVSTDWQQLELAVDGTAEATFAIDGTDVATISTNIPTAGLSYGWRIFKSAGTTPRILVVDTFVLDVLFTGPRTP